MDGVPVTSIVDECLGNSSHVVDLGDHRLAVIDPVRHPGPYLREAERRGASIAFSIETHLHADFVTGSRELAATGATVVAPAGADLAWPHRPIAGGDTVDLGVRMPRAAAATLQRFLELLDLADDFCREERLLSLARTEEQRTFQRWFLGEYIRQARGEQRTPWLEQTVQRRAAQ